MVELAVTAPLLNPSPASAVLAPTVASPVGTPRSLQEIVNPTFSPTNSYEPSADGNTYAIYDGTYRTVGGNDIFDGALRVSHQMGPAVPANMTRVELYDTNCENVKHYRDLEVWIPDYFSNGGFGVTFSYDIAFNHSLMGSAPGGFVNFTGTGLYDEFSVGVISFCTRVVLDGETFSGTVPIYYVDTNFLVSFNMTNRGFAISDTDISPANPTEFTTDPVDDAYFIEACLCDVGFSCVDASTPVQQGSPLVMCLTPRHPEGKDLVSITNYNLDITAGDISYSPVWYGSDGPENNVVTELDTDEKTQRISTLLIQDFYIENFNTIDVSGNAFLEFDVVARAPNFYTFGMLVILDPTPTGVGCFGQMFKALADLF